MGAITRDDYKNGEDNHECINGHTTTKVFISLNGGETLMNLCNAFGLKIRSDPFNRGNLNNVRDSVHILRKNRGTDSSRKHLKALSEIEVFVSEERFSARLSGNDNNSLLKL